MATLLGEVPAKGFIMVKAQLPDAAVRIAALAKKHFPQLADGDGTPSIGTENPDPTRLYELLDTLVELRLEFADGADGEMAVSPLGRAKVLEVCTMLDVAIVSTKRIINEVRPTVARR